jgi:PAS domain-containing protein
MAVPAAQPAGNISGKAHAHPAAVVGRPAVMAIIEDITEQRRLQTQLLDSERRYKQLFEHILNGFALTRS